METDQFEEAVRDYEKVHKGDRGNQEYRYRIIDSISSCMLVFYVICQYNNTLTLLDFFPPHISFHWLLSNLPIQASFTRGQTGTEEVEEEGLLQNSCCG